MVGTREAYLLTSFLLSVALSSAAEPLPTLSEYRTHVRYLDARLEEGEALVEAVAVLHNTWAGKRAPRARGTVCDQPELVTLEQRATALLTVAPLVRRRVDKGLETLTTWSTAPTVSPLLVETDGALLQRHGDRSRRLTARLDELDRWHARWIAPAVKGCAPTELEATEGIPRPAGGQTPVAALWKGPGWLCPEGVQLDGEHLIWVQGPVCGATDASCDCDAATVQPGALVTP